MNRRMRLIASADDLRRWQRLFASGYLESSRLTMTFHSILSRKAEVRSDPDTKEAPPFFLDLNLDQIVDSITAGRGEYDLKPFFYTPLRDVETIGYRHEVMQDMEDAKLMAHITSFSERMTAVRRYLALADKLYSTYHKEGWFLKAALIYCEAVTDLARNLNLASLKSRGLNDLREYVANYAFSQRFQLLQGEAQRVRHGLWGIRYCVIIQNGKFSVRKYENETDYSAEVEQIFERFKQGAVKDYRVKLEAMHGMNHIEAKILEFVARLYPDPFAALDLFCQRQSGFVDATIRVFETEIQFYVAYLEFIAKIKHEGLSFCYPQVHMASREVYAQDAFDLALARKLLYTDKPVICNDFFLEEPERIIVVSGPNQGGKTTFARMFGQLHYLASLGCPVPGRKARLSLFDQMFSHFEREEDIRNLRGKLQDDMLRLHEILTRATPKSILIVNEVFASTTLKDAVFLGQAIMRRLMELDVLSVWVTFVDELSSMSEKTISMVSTVAPENPAMRTFKIVRRTADGLAYALSIAKRHRLTYEQVTERIRA